MHRLEDADDLALVRRARADAPPMRDPNILLELITGAATTMDGR